MKRLSLLLIYLRGTRWIWFAVLLITTASVHSQGSFHLSVPVIIQMYVPATRWCVQQPAAFRKTSCRIQCCVTVRMLRSDRWGPFSKDRVNYRSDTVNHRTSPRKTFRVFLEAPISVPLIFPVTCPVIYGRLWPPVKLPGSQKCCKTKQN